MLLLTTTAELSVAVFTYTNPEKFESNLLCLSLPFLLVKNDVKTRSSLLTRQVKRRYNVAGAWKHGGSSDPEPQASNSYTNAILKWRHFITRRFENWSGSGLPYLISPQVAHRLTTRGTCCFRFFSPLSFIVLPLTASVTDSMYAALEGFNYYIWWNVLSLSLCQRREEGRGGGQINDPELSVVILGILLLPYSIRWSIVPVNLSNMCDQSCSIFWRIATYTTVQKYAFFNAI